MTHKKWPLRSLTIGAFIALSSLIMALSFYQAITTAAL